MKPDVGVIEVGWITYASILQKTVEGTEAMYLMMKNVFDDLGYRRYEWKCDNLNSKSKKAALRLGFKYEGLFRQATIYKKRNRDTAWFSILDKEWKLYKKSYRQYLKRSNFNTKFIQKKKLKLT
jgi:RimJ/RimL family protein N-acetyltransferase